MVIARPGQASCRACSKSKHAQPAELPKCGPVKCTTKLSVAMISARPRILCSAIQGVTLLQEAVPLRQASNECLQDSLICCADDYAVVQESRNTRATCRSLATAHPDLTSAREIVYAVAAAAEHDRLGHPGACLLSACACTPVQACQLVCVRACLRADKAGLTPALWVQSARRGCLRYWALLSWHSSLHRPGLSRCLSWQCSHLRSGAAADLSERLQIRALTDFQAAEASDIARVHQQRYVQALEAAVHKGREFAEVCTACAAVHKLPQQQLTWSLLCRWEHPHT